VEAKKDAEGNKTILGTYSTRTGLRVKKVTLLVRNANASYKYL